MPIKNVRDMTDDELKKLYLDAQAHVRDVHQIAPDHADFDKFLKMHPYYADGVDEYVRRGLDKVPEQIQHKSTVLNEPELQQECSLTPEEIEEGKKNLAAQAQVPEGTGEEDDVNFEEMSHGDSGTSEVSDPEQGDETK